MPYERITYETAANPKVSWGKLVLFSVALPLIPLSFIYNGKFDSVAMIIFLLGFTLSIGFYRAGVVLKRESAKSFIEAKHKLSSQGFRADFEHSPQLLIDSSSTKIAFVETGNAAYDLYNFSDVLDWEHQWINKKGTKAGSKAEQIENVLVFKMKNPHKPFAKVYIPNHAFGELWMARLNALFSG